MTLLEAFGIVSVALMLLSRASYFAAIFRGHTRPHVFSWFIWGLLSTIGFAAQVAEGAGAGSWARGFSALTSFLIVILCIKHGEKNITRADWITFTAALCAIPLWAMTKTPVYSVILVCIIDTVGYLPTIRKSWKKPREEAILGYFLSTFSAVFALLAISTYTLSTWLYPAVLVVTNCAMGLYLLQRRRLMAAVAA